jgi:hypothetical protein
MSTSQGDIAGLFGRHITRPKTPGKSGLQALQLAVLRALAALTEVMTGAVGVGMEEHVIH